MKTLAESLFDADNITKDIKFGDVYIPVRIDMNAMGPNVKWDSPLKRISNMFVMSKLKKAGKRIDVSGVDGYRSLIPKQHEALEYILGIIAELPLEEWNDKVGRWNYSGAIDKKFRDLARDPYWRNGISIDIVNMMGDMRLHIERTNSGEHSYIDVIYTKK